MNSKSVISPPSRYLCNKKKLLNKNSYSCLHLCILMIYELTYKIYEIKCFT